MNILEGPVRSGKSYSANFKFLLHVCDLGRKYPGIPFLMTGKTQETAYRNLVIPIMQLAPSLTSYKQGWLTIAGNQCQVLGVNDAVAPSKIQGGTYAGWLGDEASLYSKEFFDMARTRLSPRGSIALLTTNPDSPYHYLKREWIDKKDFHHCFVSKFTLSDNPSLDAEYVESLKRDYTGVFYRRYILGEWCIAEGVIYSGWDATLNEVHTLPPRKDAVVISIDYGTRNPCVFGKHYLSGSTWVRVDEYYWDSEREQRQKTDDEYLADLKKFVGHDTPDAVIIDPSAASFAVLLEQAGYTVVLANNDVIDGIKTLALMITRGEYKVLAPNCPDWLRERASYVWDSKAAARGEDKPLKVNDHAMDESRYFAMWANGKTTGGDYPTIITPEAAATEAELAAMEMLT